MAKDMIPWNEAREIYLRELGRMYKWKVTDMAVVAGLSEETIRNWCREFRIKISEEREKLCQPQRLLVAQA